ncbi:Outer membrane protein [Paramagnetospirillum magneticum AMB-1]|uniref:Outer membrane protein n=1 Tax=Paramagnetospirillum magneticum (strain ATCC 700264 / AMB-1) TaxID=342108 RepID=Q2W4D2_PARM1|nr:Outer membrane protein [Paramagnetospirillum magneticum AMB-1]
MRPIRPTLLRFSSPARSVFLPASVSPGSRLWGRFQSISATRWSKRSSTRKNFSGSTLEPSSDRARRHVPASRGRDVVRNSLSRRLALAARLVSLPSLALVVLLSFSGAAVAQRASSAPMSLIIVDIQQAQRDSLPGRALAAQRDKYQQNFQSEFNAARQALQRSDQDLAKQKGTMPQEAYDQKVKALELQVVAFQNKTQMAVRALEKSTDSAMAELMNAILTITGEIAAEMGANLVLPKQQVVLHEPRMDVTAQVIERLNKKLPTVNFPIPQVDDHSSPEVPPSKSGKK